MQRGRSIRGVESLRASGESNSVALSTPNTKTLLRADGSRSTPGGVSYVKMHTKTPVMTTKESLKRHSCHKDCCDAPATQSLPRAGRPHGIPTPADTSNITPFMVDDYEPIAPLTTSLRALLRRKSISHVKPATIAISRAMKKHLGCTPLAFTGTFDSTTLSALQRKLRAALARNLAQGDDKAAFAKACGIDDRPRADDLEGMYATFPYPGSIDWSAPDVEFGLNIPMWRVYHQMHCRRNCTRHITDPQCYFSYLEFFLRTGFQSPDEPSKHRPPDSLRRAHVDLWRENEEGCEQALRRWSSSEVSFLTPPTATPPRSCCGLLPVVKAKDLWKLRMQRAAGPAKARLCLNLKSSGDNDTKASWMFRYLILQRVTEEVGQHDWLTVLDIDQFYMRLPAGRRMRARQWFQDPHSYAPSDKDNKRQHINLKRWRQLLALAFGWKTAPAFASTVSAEVARTLRALGIKVVGVFIDDILLASPSEEQAETDATLAKSVLKELNIPANNKQKGPCPPHTGVPFLGFHIRPIDCSIAITDEHRQYVIERLEAIVKAKNVSYKILESLAGSLTWLCEVMLRGRPRRANLYSALARSDGSDIPIRGALSHTLHWWLNELKSPRAQLIRYWKVPPTRPLCQSDASGEDGWSACAMGLHFVGRWPKYMRQSTGTNPECMLFMEVLPVAVVAVVLAPFLHEKLMCATVDNAGAAFSINTFNCRHPATRRLMQIVVDAVSQHKFWLVAGHGRRHRNTHTDAMTHAISDALWKQVIPSADVSSHAHTYHFAVMSTTTQRCFTAAITFKNAPPLPTHGKWPRRKR